MVFSKKDFFCIVIFVILLINVALHVQYVYAASNVEIIRESTGGRFENRSVKIGETSSSDIGYKFSGGEEKSHTWSSSAANVFRVNGDGEYVSVTGVGEGTGKITISVKGKDGNTYTDSAFISVYTPIGSGIYGSTIRETALTRTGRDDNEDSNLRKVFPKGTVFRIDGISKEYYRVNIADYSSIHDGIDNGNGYIKKKDIDIPVEKILASPYDMVLHKGQEGTISTNILPSEASNKSIIWHASDSNVITVDSGRVTGKTSGISNVTAKANNGTTSNATLVSVVDVTGPHRGELNKDQIITRAAQETNAYKVKDGEKHMGLKVKGVCASFYYIEIDGINGFVPKSSVDIWGEEISITSKEKEVKLGNKAKLSCRVLSPKESNETTFKWSSSNARIATVDTNGQVRGVKQGAVIVIAKSKAGLEARSIVTVYKSINSVAGETKKKSTIKTGAHEESGNLDGGTLKKKSKVKLIGESGDYYRIKVGKSIGYIEKSKIYVPVQKIRIKRATPIKKSSKKRLIVSIKPSLAKGNKLTWRSKHPKIASVTNSGVVRGKSIGKAKIIVKVDGKKSKVTVSVVKKTDNVKKKETNATKYGAVKNKDWIKIKDIEETEKKNYRMQGIAGYKNNLFYLKRSPKSGNKKGSKVMLYHTKIKKSRKGKTTLTEPRKIGVYDKSELGTGNSMTALSGGNNRVIIYVAPGELGKKGTLKKIVVVKNGDSFKTEQKSSTIVCGDNNTAKLSKKCITGVAQWKNKNKTFIIIKTGRQNYISHFEGGSLRCDRIFQTKEPYTPDNKNYTKGQGVECDSNKNMYYVVNSFHNKLLDEKDWNRYKGISYVVKYRLYYDKGEIKKKYVRRYMLRAGNKIRLITSKGSGQALNGRFEMEEIYIYKNTAYLNSEGGGKHIDIIGEFQA